MFGTGCFQGLQLIHKRKVRTPLLKVNRPFGVITIPGIVPNLFTHNTFQLINIAAHPAFLDILFLLTGIVIALYLVQFKPKAWVSRVFQKLSSRFIRG